MDDHDAMLAIHEAMDGVEWSSATLDRIATILEQAGYPIRDLDGNLPTAGASSADHP
jgi:hypothetical protein